MSISYETHILPSLMDEEIYNNNNLAEVIRIEEDNQKLSISLLNRIERQGLMGIIDIKTCLNCSRNYTRKGGRGYKSWEKSKFCSSDCKHDYRSKHPELYPSLFKEGHIGHISGGLKNRGRKQSEETIKKRAQSMLNHPTWRESMKKLGERRSGPNHPGWKGGASLKHWAMRHVDEYKTWRLEVYRRDRWACQTCGSNKSIVAHHIKSFSDYPELKYDVNNGVTLCRSCHLSLHQPIRK